MFHRIGEGRACWSLGNVNTSLGNHKDALEYAKIHLEISKEVSIYVNWFYIWVYLYELINMIVYSLCIANPKKVVLKKCSTLKSKRARDDWYLYKRSL